MVPPPAEEHQEVVDPLFVLFSNYARAHHLGVLRTQKGVREVSAPQENYRVPEWIFLRAGREHLLRRGSSYVDEGPDVVLEVASPDDETYDKIPFYERMGVAEMVIVERDSRSVQVLRRVGAGFRPVSPNPDGWIHCAGLRAFFRREERAGVPLLLVLLELDQTEHAV